MIKMRKILSSLTAGAVVGAAVLGASPHRSGAITRPGIAEAMRYGTAILAPRTGKSSAAGALTIIGDVNSLKLALSVTHLRPKKTYSVLIYTGSCGASNLGAVQYILPDIMTDAQGRATLVTKLLTLGVAGNWYIDVPVKQTDRTKAPGPGVVCGNIQRAGVDVPLAAPEIGYKAGGHVLVTRHITKQGVVDLSRTLGTEVAVYADHLSPRATYTAAIVTGRCGGPAPLKYRLSGLVSDAAGEAVAVTYFSFSVPHTDLAVELEDTHGHVATCGNFPGYGLMQPSSRS